MDAKKAELDHDEAQLRVLFDEMIQMGLWCVHLFLPYLSSPSPDLPLA